MMCGREGHLEAELKNIATDLLQTIDAGEQRQPITAIYPTFGLAEAYQVANLVHRQRLAQGWLPLGRKIGFTNANLWPVYGVEEPVWAFMYDRTVHRLSDSTAHCAIAGYCEPKIEPELVVHFASAPPAGGSLAEILACIDWLALGFEVVQCHYPGWRFQAADTVADSGLHAALYVGEPHPLDAWEGDCLAALQNFEVSLSCDGALREMGYGANVLGHPLKAIQHLMSVLSTQNPSAPIQAGEIITTGTLTSAMAIEHAQTWRVEASGVPLKGLTLHFEG